MSLRLEGAPHLFILGLQASAVGFVYRRTASEGVSSPRFHGKALDELVLWVLRSIWVVFGVFDCSSLKTRVLIRVIIVWGEKGRIVHGDVVIGMVRWSVSFGSAWDSITSSCPRLSPLSSKKSLLVAVALRALPNMLIDGFYLHLGIRQRPSLQNATEHWMDELKSASLNDADSVLSGLSEFKPSYHHDHDHDHEEVTFIKSGFELCH
ncbi:hypothetical protein SISSUDRAFT_1036232 [Sistotremastrum suecicum HHB10207 ss-3]|uniref:Uncharacterized protein n=1 Tax=Sistotremastrum suecicum HHB10207 ss-3 TaxID=1314776 RepID=A0A165ZQC4_9AGAM|nr:hypothetical protein SISSUDRAFT_1036232 [Sistotremastrum suecicum HHB10207 ss-3]